MQRANGGGPSATHRPSAIQDEAAWRERPRPAAGVAQEVLLARWRGTAAGPEESSTTGDPGFFTIGFPLRPTQGALFVGNSLALRGRAFPGWVQITPPATAARIEIEGSYDQLHLFLDSGSLARSFEEVHDRSAPADLTLFSHGPSHDPVLERLGSALVAADEILDDAVQLYVDSLSVAVIMRLISLYSNSAVGERKKVEGLAKWRLARTFEFVSAHLADPIRLQDIARAAGLTRMHFAAQFRAATGLRPHEFLLRTRIDRAQELLRHTRMPLAEVALSVGFQTQAHFTTVFRRYAGETPNRWRQQNVL